MARAVLDPLAVRRTLKAEGLRASHARSQNFLADPEVLQAILDLAEVHPGRRVLEIGPGLGILTGGLLAGGADVTAIELDLGLAAYLRRRFEAELAGGRGGGGNLRLIEGDALDQPLLSLVEPPFEVVANLPYHVTSPTLHRLLGALPRPERLVLMLQLEVAERIAAEPGAMSYLATFVQYHAEVRVARRVPAAAFEPAPKVDSAIVVLRPRPTVALGPPGCTAEDGLWRLVQAGFRERRKMLHNVLARQLPFDSHVVTAALAEVGIAGDRRPQTLSVDDWLRLLAVLPPLSATAAHDVADAGAP